ncbi:cobaltochelatase subunit CobN [Desulfomonile tiedjei]|uniref:Mg chelatase, cobalamin biosynthesis protein CobN n=1 Tax=Desulfomonile tiedjei (strain ATCC 49306 / DSM 6799 / DCB-1) TaxID=706587 RepID=I4CEQ6_DESTA|nr:cobaltochelatase subunit CobN [Desulfomonile tiedjei]AFM28047.1 Mg chelatase, cobalamin biosynthesis protein CobN [Desulfomonile tiedjei DSM 6799]
MHICTVMWSNYLPLIKEAADELGITLTSFSTKQLNMTPGLVDEVKSSLRSADCILLYRTMEGFWDELEPEIRELRDHIPVVVVGSDPSFWALSSIAPETVATVYRYILFNGRENMANMLRYLMHSLFGQDIKYGEPEEVPWQGIYHPAGPDLFQETDAYLSWYRDWLGVEPLQFVGLLYLRTAWATGNLDVERSLIAAFERLGVGVIPIFMYPLKDPGLGNLGGVEVIENFLIRDGKPLVEGVIKLTVFFLGNSRGEMKAEDAPSGIEVMKRLNMPLFSPVTSYYKNAEQWLEDPSGLGMQVAWSMAMPEFEGVIEPIIIGAAQNISQPEEESYEPIHERIDRFAKRIEGWLHLRKKPNPEKRVAFILHNNPCASVEATVGGGAHLDTLETVADILKRLASEGYSVQPPADGKDLIETIMDRKAISEFRWTTVEEIVDKGGVLAMVTKEQYEEWFNELPEAVRVRMADAWGNPPGEEKDGIPAAMVYDNKILVTGVQYGNAVVCVQPKRGCAGAKCDGQVCKILHDPDVPPPHQYVATYKWLSREFGVDAIVHVGTHGNLEFLPGKATGLSSGCFPDIGIDTMPHLYIYNADNPPEGTIAKRRSIAVLVDHMQTVMVKGELYGDLDQLARLIDEYQRFQNTEPARAHTIQHMIMEQAKTLNLLDGKELNHDNFSERIHDLHDSLQVLKEMHIPKGMHIFGRLPSDEKLADFVHAIIRFDTGEGSLRWLIARLIEQMQTLDEEALREQADDECNRICRVMVLNDSTLRTALEERYRIPDDLAYHIPQLEKNIASVICNVQDTDEVGSLLNGFDGGYIEPGPSGLITRGRSDILPTGRNFYSLDPQRVPTTSAWEIGKKLADRTVEKYLNDEGHYPETIAFYWQCTDIMWSDGEGMAQMMYLLGTRPIWRNNGRLKGFDVIPLEELGRPRIDVTIRVSGITRDNFPSTIDVLDEIVQAVAMLDEPLDQNYVRQHTLERLNGSSIDDAEAVRAATYRIFASMPGTYQAGTQLAVYASAWKTEKDLSDVFLYWNGYAYGKDVFGEAAHRSLADNLKTVDVTFNKTVTDEYDLTGCCCYFGTHGGMINAARVLSGKNIQNYYGDTREQDRVSVRTLTEEMRRIARGKILNPKWIEGMKEHGYKGAGEISKRVGRVYGWQATAKAVDDSVFDDIARTFMMNEENRKFFEENNPWALEEIARRLIEAAERELWNPAPDVKEALKELYVEIEGWIEERMGDVKGDFQGGSIDIITSEEVENWKRKMEQVL